MQAVRANRRCGHPFSCCHRRCRARILQRHSSETPKVARGEFFLPGCQRHAATPEPRQVSGDAARTRRARRCTPPLKYPCPSLGKKKTFWFCAARLRVGRLCRALAGDREFQLPVRTLHAASVHLRAKSRSRPFVWVIIDSSGRCVRRHTALVRRHVPNAKIIPKRAPLSRAS
jgi:hypothetical protein